MYAFLVKFSGRFPLFVIKERTENIIESLIACTQITDETAKWAESRKEALHSLTMVCQTLGVENSGNYFQYSGKNSIFIYELIFIRIQQLKRLNLICYQFFFGSIFRYMETICQSIVRLLFIGSQRIHDR